MEFACGFIYVPPSTNQKEGQRSSPNVIKRSALLPPHNRVRPRPRSPPPPPPTELKNPQSTSPGKRAEEVKTPPNHSPFYENAAFLLQGGAGVPGTPRSHPSSATPKIALLPPTRPSPTFTSQPSCIQPIITPPSTSSLNGLTSDLPKEKPDPGVHPRDQNCSYPLPEGRHASSSPASGHNLPTQKSVAPSPPALPPRRSFMKSVPDYVVVLPASSRTSPQTPPLDVAPMAKDKQPLPGNPNVILVSLGRVLSEDVLTIQGEPTSCSQCGSALDSCYDNVVDVCYFCQLWEPSPSVSVSPSPSPTPSPQPRCPQIGCQDSLFLLSPCDDTASPPAEALLLFCIDISGSMSTTSQVFDGRQTIYKSRLQFVQEAVLQCVDKLSKSQPSTQVGLITFNNQVTLHGYEEVTSRFLLGAELMDTEYLKQVASSFPRPPPLSRTRDCLQRQVLGLEESGATALGPACLLAITMASRQPGSKVIICTDGKANTELGNLEVEDINARTLLSSTIFYQNLGEYAASQGVTMSLLSIEGTDCRLDELGRLADRTGGKVVIARPHKLHTEFEEMIENRTIATHCSVTLLLPKALCVRGERQAGHRGTREVGNVASDTEITFQFGGQEHPDMIGLAPGSRVSVQLQLRYRQRDGQRVLRVLTADRDVTDDSVLVLSALSLDIVQLNCSQASAALAVRGRFLDAHRDAQTQRELIERALEHNGSVEDQHIYNEWMKTMDPIYNSIHNYTRRKSVFSDSQSLTDAGASLLYSMKNSNRKSISMKETSRS